MFDILPSDVVRCRPKVMIFLHRQENVIVKLQCHSFSRNFELCDQFKFGAHAIIHVFEYFPWPVSCYGKKFCFI